MHIIAILVLLVTHQAFGDDGDPKTNITNMTHPMARCTTGNTINCQYRTTTIGGRWVGYQYPEGTAPSNGWPAVILYHGWNLMNSQYCWYATTSYTNGLYYKAETISYLLNNGFAVITPDALTSLKYWQTNMNTYATADLSKWVGSQDDILVTNLIYECARGTFGPCDQNRLGAIGFSSGGYMTGRMAVNYQKDFKALVINSGSYYYCSGSCNENIANQLDQSYWRNHPPTLFLHGSRDSTVPASTSTMYYNKLNGYGVATSRKTENVNHQWLKSAPSEILKWMQAHL